MRQVQETWEEPGSPFITPLWLCRIVCNNCGKTSPWVDSFDKACEYFEGVDAK